MPARVQGYCNMNRPAMAAHASFLHVTHRESIDESDVIYGGFRSHPRLRRALQSSFQWSVCLALRMQQRSPQRPALDDLFWPGLQCSIHERRRPHHSPRHWTMLMSQCLRQVDQVHAPSSARVLARTIFATNPSTPNENFLHTLTRVTFSTYLSS